MLLLTAFLGLRSDVLWLNAAQRVAFEHQYSLVGWEARNLLSKWVHRLVSAVPWRSGGGADRESQVVEYFALGERLMALGAELEEAAAESPGGPSVAALQSELDRLRSAQRRLRDDVEETLEATVSAVFVEQGILQWGGLLFPPVDVRLAEPPKLLVTSDRDRIVRRHDVLLDPGVSVQQGEAMERALENGYDLSGLVTQLGGVATYPASVANTASLQATLRLISHEWLHHYLAFQPLGRNIASSLQMQTLNETLAQIADREAGDLAFQMLGGTPDPPSTGGEEAPQVAESHDAYEFEFEFDSEMRKTRQRVDELLASGNVERAEAYMEERRRLFVANGFHIRKMNQAYFAFHGTYAESPASVSPIADQLHRFRALVPDLRTFVTNVSKFSSYEQFVDALRRMEQPTASR